MHFTACPTSIDVSSAHVVSDILAHEMLDPNHRPIWYVTQEYSYAELTLNKEPSCKALHMVVCIDVDVPRSDCRKCSPRKVHMARNTSFRICCGHNGPRKATGIARMALRHGMLYHSGACKLCRVFRMAVCIFRDPLAPHLLRRIVCSRNIFVDRRDHKAGRHLYHNSQ